MENMGTPLAGMITVDDISMNEEEGLKVEMVSVDYIIESPYNIISRYPKEKQDAMVDSIKELGIRQPLIVREVKRGDDDMAELIDGHNRLNCAKLAGLTTVPVVFKEYTNNDARFVNLEAILQQRGFDELKPSERAAVVMELKRFEDEEFADDEDTINCEDKKRLVETISKRSIYNYSDFYRCVDGIKVMVDDGDLPLTVAIMLSKLKVEHQNYIAECLSNPDLELKINPSKAKMLKSNAADLTNEMILEILRGVKKSKGRPKSNSFKIPSEFSKHFENLEKDEMENLVFDILRNYFDGNEEDNQIENAEIDAEG